MPRHTPDPLAASRRLAGDLAMRLQTPLLPDDPEERLNLEWDAHWRLSEGEQELLEICDAIADIGSRSRHIDDDLRRSLASTLRRLAEVVEP